MHLGARRRQAEHHPRAAACAAGPVVEADRRARDRRPGPCPRRPARRRSGPAGGARPPRAASPVIQRLVPSGAAVRPSRLAAILRTTQGCPVRAVLEVGGQLLGRPRRRPPHGDLDAGGPQRGDAPAGHLGVGVLDADDDPGHPRRDDGVGTGRRAAMVGAGLQGHVERGRPRAASPACGQRRHLGMGPAGRRRGSGEHRPAVRSRVRRDDDACPPRGWAPWSNGPLPPAPALGACAPRRPWSGPCPGWVPGLVRPI